MALPSTPRYSGEKAVSVPNAPHEPLTGGPPAKVDTVQLGPVVVPPLEVPVVPALELDEAPEEVAGPVVVPVVPAVVAGPVVEPAELPVDEPAELLAAAVPVELPALVPVEEALVVPPFEVPHAEMANPSTNAPRLK